MKPKPTPTTTVTSLAPAEAAAIIRASGHDYRPALREMVGLVLKMRHDDLTTEDHNQPIEVKTWTR